MLASECVGLRLNRRLYLWRGVLRIVESEDVSLRVSKEEVVCLEAELERGKHG